MEKELLVSLVTKAQQGDNNAMNELFNAFYNDFYYFALKTVKDDDLALDITQEAFVEIINTIGKLEEPAAFVTWAKQITYHQCTRYFKKKKDVIVDEDEEGNSVFDTLKEENAEFIPDEALDKDDFKKTVMAILDELSEEQRSATMMYYFDEMSIKQIAEIQGVSEGTIKSRLNYARKAIKQAVEDYEKKNGIKLHAVPFLPLLKWIFEGAFEGSLPTASAELLAEGVATATGTTITATATATATATTAATVTTTAGVAAKIAALPIATKIIAGIAAVTIAVGGGTVVVVLSQDDKNNNDNNPAITDTIEELILEGIIPEGCTYTLHDGTVLTAGQSFPEKCTTGDYVTYGDYYYGYECMYIDDGGQAEWYLWKDYFDAIDSGLIESDVYEAWTVMAQDKTKTEYGQIASYINGTPVTNLYATFYGCEKLIKAPVIPNTVTAMTGTFYGCKSLKTAPALPANVQRIMLTFAECTALEGDVVINVTLDKSHHWLYSDTFMRTENKINLTGKTPEEDLILIAKASDNKNITVNGKKVDYSSNEAEKLALLKNKANFGNKKYAMNALTYFNDATKISAENIIWFGLYESIIDKISDYSVRIDENNNEYYLVPISVYDEITLKYFGTTYNFSKITETISEDSGTWEAKYVPVKDSIDAIELILKPMGSGDPGGPEVTDYIKIDDTTYQVNITWYDPSSEKPTDPNAVYYPLDDYYMVGYNFEKMIFEFIDGDWVIKSYSKL